MIKTETIQINGIDYKRTYSDIDAVVRCGRKRYIDAVDPIDVTKAYFEEGVDYGNEEE